MPKEQDAPDPMTPLDILKACCARTNGRYALVNPFRLGEHVYATDGRICARAAIEGEFPCPRKPPRAETLDWARDRYDADPAPMPTIAPVAPKCEACGGKGILTQKHSCGRREYDEECEECMDGLDWFRMPLTDLGGVHIAAYFTALLVRFGARVHPMSDPKKRARSAVYWHCANGVSGLLMPVRTDPPRIR